tara:strand:+ start:474 stop:1010 length:537 start_codon:yes stop_codon:yes gene_type:complete
MTGIVNSTGARSGVIGTTVGTPTSGITHASSWVVNDNLTGGHNPISTDLSELSRDGYTRKGAALTQSSGVFTFPVTGLWYILFQVTAEMNDDSRRNSIYIITTHDDSTWVDAAVSGHHISRVESDWTRSMAMCSHLFSVGGVTTHKVSFQIAFHVDVVTQGSANSMFTGMQFIRLGDL